MNSIEEKDNKSNYILSKIRRIVILKKVFSYLFKKTLLLFVKYNKQLKTKLNIYPKDYIRYNEIEIEIELEKNKYGKFINFPENPDDKSHFHIYINGKERFYPKRDFIEKEEKVKNIRVVIDYGFNTFYRLFHNCEYITSITFIHFERNNITNMKQMFNKCSSLRKLNTLNIFLF